MNVLGIKAAYTHTREASRLENVEEVPSIQTTSKHNDDSVFGLLTLKSDQHLQIKVGAPTTKAICFWSRERHRSELMQQ